MTITVTLSTDRPAFPSLWRPFLARHGLEARVCVPDQLASMVQSGSVIVFDGGSAAYTEDELLAAVGFARALGAVPLVQLPESGVMSEVDDVLDEMCTGQVARHASDVSRLAAAIARRLDQDRTKRFEFVTISPRDSEILAILGDGTSLLMSRPVNDRDDGSDVRTITLTEDADRATLELATGAKLELNADALAASGDEVDHAPIDGPRLGARLRELRLKAGLTQAELARRTGIHRPNIARVEAGRHTPSLETLARLAEAIGVPTTRVLAPSR